MCTAVYGYIYYEFLGLFEALTACQESAVVRLVQLVYCFSTCFRILFGSHCNATRSPSQPANQRSNCLFAFKYSGDCVIAFGPSHDHNVILRSGCTDDRVYI